MGRHGGINILHQKSWHVWRMDNRLRVERDELQHAQREAERKKAERKEAFETKLRKLRRSAAGEPAIEDDVEKLEDLEPLPLTPSAPSRTSTKQEEGDAYGKYGVTKSGLKEAEKDLDNSLRRKASAQGRSYWGKEGLGSGPHINLFEQAELEVKRQDAAHTKLLRYQETNNNLAEKGKKRPMSEFDEMASEQPWYLQVQPRPSSEEDSKETLLRKKWSRKHDQLTLEVVPQKEPKVPKQSSPLAISNGLAEEPLTVMDKVEVEEVDESPSETDSGKKHSPKKARKKSKRRKDKKKKKERKANQEVLAELRRERALREEAERQRAAQLRPLCAR